MSQLTITPALLKRAAIAACKANGLNPNELISNPYNMKGPRSSMLPRQLMLRWQWLQELCPELEAVLTVGLMEGIKRA